MADYNSGYDQKYGYNKNAFEKRTVGTTVMGLVVKGITTPIGLVSEAIHDYKDKKKPESQQEDTVVYVSVPEDQAKDLIAQGQGFAAEGHAATHELVPDTPVPDDLDHDEADWELDEVSSIQEVGVVDVTGVEVDSMIQQIRASSTAVKNRRQTKETPEAHPNLPFPVIIPQRRPGTKTRGFIRAYAPALEEVGIDQSMFLSFIENLHKAAQASPVLNVLVVATGLASFVPEPTIGLSLQAAQIVLAMAQEAQERWKTNKFLELANKEIFAPRGLFAMLVKYKAVPSGQDDIAVETIDLGAQALAKHGGSLLRNSNSESNEVVQDQSKIAQFKEKTQQRLRVADGEVRSESQMPVTCAPLIFPAIEQQAMKTTRDGSNETLAKWSSTSKSVSMWMGDYFDRRAQASFAFKNPDSKLASSSSPVTFKSKFADPNHAVNTHFFTLITGGRYKAEPLGAKRRWEKAKRKEAEKRAQGQKVKPSKRLLAEDVLYLQIVNMPTEAELESARQALKEKVKGRKA